MKLRKIIFIDAINASSWYNFCLMSIFAKANLPVEFLTSKFLWEKDFPDPPNTRTFFFTKSTYICERLKLSQKTRQFLRALEYPFDLWKLSNFVIKNNIKTVHFNWSRLPKLDILLIKYLVRKGIRVIYTAHNFLPHDTGEKHMQEYGKIYRNVNHIITLSEYVKNQIVQKVHISPDKITVIPHTNYKPVLDVFQSNGKSQSSNQKLFSFLFFGALHSYKGIDLLLKAFKIVIENQPNCILKIYGNNFLKDNQLEKLIENLSLDTDKLDMKLQFIPMKDCINYIRESSIVVLPYRRSSQSGVIPLVNSIGKPVIATKVGGIPEMIVDGISGYLVKPESPEALAEKMLAICNNISKLRELSVGAQRATETIFSDDLILDKFSKIYFDNQ